MIRTQDLVGFLETTMISNVEFKNCYNLNEIKEYKAEIVARLEMHDELKEGIKKIIASLCPQPSNGVDK